MTPYFLDDKKWTDFREIVEGWIGTPYKHLGMVRGREADCTLFVGACMVEAGLLMRVEYDYYPRDWHVHTCQEVVLEGFERHFRKHLASGVAVEKLAVESEIMRGDVCVFTTTKKGVSNHAGIALGDGSFINAINCRGVCRLSLRRWMPKMTTLYRVMVEN
jgi:cell wall-associated NlpC family hydrolase